MTDRRRRVRVALSLPLRLFRTDGGSTNSRTINVSSQGFYCCVSGPFTAGEFIRCLVALPAFDPVRREGLIALDCRARVVRVEFLGPNMYGLGCSIEQYQVITLDNDWLLTHTVSQTA